MRVLISGASGMIGARSPRALRSKVTTFLRSCDPNPTARGFRGIPELPSRIIPTWKVSMRWCTWPGQGLPIEDGPPPARISSGTVEWNRPPIFDPLLKNATLRPRGSSVLPPLAGTATGTTTSLTNHLHQAMDSWRTSAPPGSQPLKATRWPVLVCDLAWCWIDLEAH